MMLAVRMIDLQSGRTFYEEVRHFACLPPGDALMIKALHHITILEAIWRRMEGWMVVLQGRTNGYPAAAGRSTEAHGLADAQHPTVPGEQLERLSETRFGHGLFSERVKKIVDV